MGTVFAIFSPTGGVGVSTIAAHLAYFLSETRETGILDMIPDFGSITDILSFCPKPSSNKFPLIFEASTPILSELTHPKRGHLKVFVMPPSLMAQQIDWKAFIASARKSFAYTILDLPHTYLAPELTVGLTYADQIFCVGEYHWATIQSLKAFFDGCDINLSEKCKVIINRSEWLPQEVIDECRLNLGREVYAEIPYDPPLEAARKIRENSAFGKAMKRMAAGLIPEDTP